MPARILTPADLWSLPRLAPPVPAPDGARMVVTATTYDDEHDSGRSRCWLVDRETVEATPEAGAVALTAEAASSSSVAFSPDGSRIVFTRPSGTGRHGTQSQLHVLPLDGGEARCATDLAGGASSPRWIDANRVAFLSWVDAPGTERDDDVVRPRVSEDWFMRHWDRWLTDGRRLHLFAADLESGVVLDLTPGLEGWIDTQAPDGRFDVSPDGAWIALEASRTKRPEDPMRRGVHLLRLPRTLKIGAAPPASRDVTPKKPGNAFLPRFAPDGRSLLYGFMHQPDDWSDRVRLGEYDLKTRKHRALSGDWDFDPAEWIWDESGKRIWALALDNGHSGLFALDVGKARRATRGVAPERILRGGSLSGLRCAGGRLFALHSSLEAPPEAVSIDPAGPELRTHTAFASSRLKGFALGRVEDLAFEGARGEPVQMFLVHPPRGTVESGPRPLIHLIHGGPHAAFADQWHWRWSAQTFAARGMLVALVNYHGSDGGGQAWTSSIRGAWGDLPFQDVELATDWLVARRGADPKRLAVSGGSYGGYLVSWICSQTDRYACAINHAGVCDLQAQFACDAPTGWPTCVGGAPWSDLDGLDRYNPMRHARGFRTPMLILHGEKDARVPEQQAIALYNVHKALGIPARIVLYPDENHWILKRRNAIHWHEEVFGWLDRWCAGRRPSTRRAARRR